MPSKDVSLVNTQNAARAKQIYLASRSPGESARDWREALREARGLIADALRASDYMRDPASALEKSGAHMLAFRQFLAPPMSQDQFALLCPVWSKSSEAPKRKLGANLAAEVSFILNQWVDRAAVPWLAAGRGPNKAELRNTLQRTSVLIALQRFQTMQRTKGSAEQEAAVVQLLLSMGWTKRPSTLIDTPARVAPRTFMHKTKFATATSAPQEVDVACGLNKTVVAAIECKVTNDATNSVKRINDVLKKASAWQTHWGSFVETVAVLQGVIASKDVDRLSDGNVRIFWSHDLEKLRDWLVDRVD